MARHRKIFLAIACFISIFLGIAAWGKFFHPIESLKLMDRWVSLFEVVLICLLLLFRLKAGLWISASVIFASWIGYSLFWCCLALPCNCMGAEIAMPSGWAMGLDILFFALSLMVAYLLDTPPAVLFVAILIGAFLGLCGYMFAEFIFFKKILNMPWSLFGDSL